MYPLLVDPYYIGSTLWQIVITKDKPVVDQYCMVASFSRSVLHMINVCTIWYNITRVQPEMGIYKRKQESKKTRKKELDQESDQATKKKEKNFLFFLIIFLVEFLLSFLFSFFLGRVLFFFFSCFLTFLFSFINSLLSVPTVK